MANTIDEVSNHQLFKTPSRFEKEFKEWNEDNPKVSKERYERLLPLAQLVFENIRKSEVAQIPNFALHEGYPNLNEARGQFSQYISNGNEAHLNEVINRLGLVLKSFPSRYRSNAKAIYSSVITDIAKKSNESLVALQEKIDSNLEELNGIAATAEKLKSDIEAERQRISDGLGNVETQFTQAQAARRNSFQEQLDSFSSRSEAELDDAQRNLEDFLETNFESIKEERAERSAQLNDIAQDAALKHSEILTLYGLVGRDAQIGAYAQEASDARSAANFWDIIVFASMICGLAILIGPSLITYARDGFSELDWTQILSRIPISAVVFAPAGYAGAQARRQKKILDNSKQRQLQLEALGPYLSKLPKQSQEHIRAILTPRFFSSNQDEKFTIEELKSVLLSETKNENEE